MHQLSPSDDIDDQISSYWWCSSDDDMDFYDGSDDDYCYHDYDTDNYDNRNVISIVI
jgi:hypothetical protein